MSLVWVSGFEGPGEESRISTNHVTAGLALQWSDAWPFSSPQGSMHRRSRNLDWEEGLVKCILLCCPGVPPVPSLVKGTLLAHPHHHSVGEILTERSGQVLNQELPGDRELMKPPPVSL